MPILVRWVQAGAIRAGSVMPKRLFAGIAVAQSNLGYMYAHGQGVAQDFAEAYLWLSVAAAQGGADAADNRDDIARQMTPDQIAEAQRLARDWKAKPE